MREQKEKKGDTIEGETRTTTTTTTTTITTATAAVTVAIQRTNESTSHIVE